MCFNVPYIADHLRWKSFTVEEMNCNLLENFCSCVVVLCIAQGYGLSLITGKASCYQSSCKNRKTFPPQMICNIQYVMQNL